MKVVDGLKEQFNFEIQSGYLYLSISAYFKSLDMNGFAHFMSKQAHEEFEHATDFYNFLFAIGERPEFDKIDKPVSEFKGVVEAFSAALNHEILVTNRIEKLYGDAIEQNNYKVVEFLGKYIAEQVEEVDTFNSLVTRLERVNDNWGGLYILDRELSAR